MALMKQKVAGRVMVSHNGLVDSIARDFFALFPTGIAADHKKDTKGDQKIRYRGLKRVVHGNSGFEFLGSYLAPRRAGISDPISALNPA
jgi:hypothetical protein